MRAYTDVKGLSPEAAGRAVVTLEREKRYLQVPIDPAPIGRPMTDELSRNERIKEASDYLRGTLADGLREEITGAIIEDDAQLVKFHGMYLQDDRDLRPERAARRWRRPSPS